MDKLAIYGGNPARSHILPYGRQWIDEADIDQVVQVLRGDFLTQGPHIAQFEQNVAHKANAKFAVAFCNGTAALHGATYAAGIGPGDEVITSAITFVASANCVLYQQGKPVFVDIDLDTFLIDFDDLQRKVTAKTKAIIPVDFTGQPIDMRKFQDFANENGLVMIQDAAHSLGASFNGEVVGSVADMTMFSFHPVKPVTTGEGGVIVTNHEHFYRRLVQFRTHGITREANNFIYESEGPWYYEMQALGYNYRLTDLQAALGSSQMHKLDRFVSLRQDIAAQYNASFTEMEEAGLMYRPKLQLQAISGWHLYILRLNLSNLKADRRLIFEALRAENIGVNVHYAPVYLQPYYRSLGYQPGLCPIAEEAYNGLITLPLFPQMNKNDVESVVHAVSKVLYHFSKKRNAK